MQFRIPRGNGCLFLENVLRLQAAVLFSVWSLAKRVPPCVVYFRILSSAKLIHYSVLCILLVHGLYLPRLGWSGQDKKEINGFSFLTETCSFTLPEYNIVLNDWNIITINIYVLCFLESSNPIWMKQQNVISAQP